MLAPVVLTHYRGRHRLGWAARAASREHEPCGGARCSSEIWLVHQPASLMRRCQNGPVACFELLVVDGTVYDADVGRRLAGSVDHGRHEGNEPNMHPWCTEDVPGPTASMDRGHREAPAVIVVGQWTGQEASALRQALNDHPGVCRAPRRCRRTVAKWEAHGSAIIPVPVMQAVLDTVLARVEEAKAGSECSWPHPETACSTRNPEPKSSPNSAAPCSPRPPRFLNALIPKRLAGYGRSSWST